LAVALPVPSPDVSTGEEPLPGMLPLTLLVAPVLAAGELLVPPSEAFAVPLALNEAVPPLPAENLPSEVDVLCTTVVPLLVTPTSETPLTLASDLANPLPLTPVWPVTLALPLVTFPTGTTDTDAPPLLLALNEPSPLLAPDDSPDIDTLAPLAFSTARSCEIEPAVAMSSPLTATLELVLAVDEPSEAVVLPLAVPENEPSSPLMPLVWLIETPEAPLLLADALLLEVAPATALPDPLTPALEFELTLADEPPNPPEEPLLAVLADPLPAVPPETDALPPALPEKDPPPVLEPLAPAELWADPPPALLAVPLELPCEEAEPPPEAPACADDDPPAETMPAWAVNVSTW
jgi:hypothetical protein